MIRYRKEIDVIPVDKIGIKRVLIKRLMRYQMSIVL